MKQIKYIGLFKSIEGHEYTLSVYCFGFLQAFFLLTAEAIKTGKHYQLYNITDEKDNKFLTPYNNHQIIHNLHPLIPPPTSDNFSPKPQQNPARSAVLTSRNPRDAEMARFTSGRERILINS